MTLAHLHQGRAIPNTKTNVIAAGPNQRFQEEKDWYYMIEKENEKSERCGPVTFTEACIFGVINCHVQHLFNEKFHFLVERAMGSKNNNPTN